jgi:hypothetical protein
VEVTSIETNPICYTLYPGAVARYDSLLDEAQGYCDQKAEDLEGDIVVGPLSIWDVVDPTDEWIEIVDDPANAPIFDGRGLELDAL